MNFDTPFDAAMPDEIFYLDTDEDDLKDSPYAHYRDLHTGDSWRKQMKVVVPNTMSGSDYSGSIVSQSNYEVFLEKFGDVEGVYRLTGDYSSYGVAIKADLKNKEIAECIAALHDYPLIDDDAYSELETQIQGEAWESWGHTDFVRAIEKQFEIEDLEFDNDDDCLELFEAARDKANLYWEPQTGCDVYINMTRVVKEGVWCTLVESMEDRCRLVFYVMDRDIGFDKERVFATAIDTEEYEDE